jgi:single stranded DNA-binding protein
MADINKVWLSGLAITQPVLTKIAERTPLASFTLQINERFKDRSGTVQVKPNLIKIESLGKNADTVMDRVREGKRYIVDGYLRQDRYSDQDEVKVRSFATYADDSAEDTSYREGLNHAMKILLNSHNLDSALNKIKVLVENY